MEGTVLCVRGSERHVPEWAVPLSTDGLVIRSVTPEALGGATRITGVDCAVVNAGETSGASLAAVETIRAERPDVPVIVCSHAPDGDLAAASTRLGATEYHVLDSSDPSLSDRVRAHLSENVGPSATTGSARSDGGPDAGSGPRALGGSPGDADASAPNRAEELPQDKTETAAPEQDESPSADQTETPSPDQDETSPSDQTETAPADREKTPGGRSPEEIGLSAFDALASSTADGIVLTDGHGDVLFANEGLANLTGYDRPELLGSSFAKLVPDEREPEFEETLASYRESNETGTVWEYAEVPVLTSDGDQRFAAASFGAFTQAGETYFAGILRDVDDRRERDRKLEELLETSRSLLGAHSRTEVAEIAADAAVETIGFDVNLVRLYDPDEDALEPVATSGETGAILGDRPVYDVGEGGPGRAFETDEVLRYPDDVGPDVVGDLGPIEEAIYVPLGEQGTLSVGATERDAFSASDVSTTEIFASSAAVALDRAAREEELARYRTVLENVRDKVYVIDESERFSLVTEPLADWLGRDRADLVGARPESVLDDGEVEAFESVIGDLWRSGDDAGRTVETTFVTAEGERLPAEVEVTLLPADGEFSGTVGVVRDRSELVAARRELAEQRDRFSHLFDTLPDPVVEVRFEDDEPIAETINDAFTEVFGYDRATVRGEPINDYLLSPDRRDEARQIDAQVSTGEVVQRTVRRETADGYRDFLFRSVPYEASDGSIRAFAVYTDITDQRERERRLGVLNRVLRHNLRNDLNVLVGQAELIEQRANDDRIAERAAALLEKAADVTSLADRARLLERIVGRDPPEDRVAATELVADPIADCGGRYPAATIEWDVSNAAVLGDERLQLAVTELLENALEHGGEEPTVHVETEVRDETVAIRVLDDGPGIPETDREVVDGTADITQLQHGAGLGLWLAKWLCESCGGRLRFEESPLGGAGVALVLQRP